MGVGSIRVVMLDQAAASWAMVGSSRSNPTGAVRDNVLRLTKQSRVRNEDPGIRLYCPAGGETSKRCSESKLREVCEQFDLRAL
jgi:hypothetical protein